VAKERIENVVEALPNGEDQDMEAETRRVAIVRARYRNEADMIQFLATIKENQIPLDND
jgi:hypothetical protein